MAVSRSSLDRRLARLEQSQAKPGPVWSPDRKRYMLLIEGLVAFHLGDHVSGQSIASGMATAYGYGSAQEMKRALMHDRDDFNRRRSPVVAQLLSMKGCAVDAGDPEITYALEALLNDLSDEQRCYLERSGVLSPLRLSVVDYML